ncbi:MAG TPA: Uma2 family endonuclease [Blastocatellia bacterium]|jgi:Uma2 family endonuclease|nr:Uma2 family endonuclease [Blastocatellia bacterium]
MTTTRQSNYLDTIEALPPGRSLILNDVSWEEYEQLLDDLGDSSGNRVTYYEGRLEIVSPSSNHEMYEELILLIGHVIGDEMGCDVESRGSTTFKQKSLAKGAEPDTCFYVQNASRIIGKLKIDLSADPPPDIAVEIDVSHRSKTKLAIYERFGVPEVWRYDQRRMRIYLLTPQGYVEAAASLTFPYLTCDVLTDLLERSKTMGQSAVLRSFREWLREHSKGK